MAYTIVLDHSLLERVVFLASIEKRANAGYMISCS